jgi:hypothetical protein
MVRTIGFCPVVVGAAGAVAGAIAGASSMGRGARSSIMPVGRPRLPVVAGIEETEE